MIWASEVSRCGNVGPSSAGIRRTFPVAASQCQCDTVKYGDVSVTGAAAALSADSHSPMLRCVPSVGALSRPGTSARIAARRAGETISVPSAPMRISDLAASAIGAICGLCSAARSMSECRRACASSLGRPPAASAAVSAARSAASSGAGAVLSSRACSRGSITAVMMPRNAAGQRRRRAHREEVSPVHGPGKRPAAAARRYRAVRTHRRVPAPAAQVWPPAARARRVRRARRARRARRVRAQGRVLYQPPAGWELQARVQPREEAVSRSGTSAMNPSSPTTESRSVTSPVEVSTRPSPR